MKTKMIISMMLLALLPRIAYCNKMTADNDSIYINGMPLNKYIQMNKSKNEKYANGKIITKTLSLPDFHAIKNNLGFNIVYTQGNKQKVTYKGSSEFFDFIKFTVSNGCLTINTKKKNRNNTTCDSPILYITTPSLDDIQNNGSLHFKSAALKVNNLQLQNNGSMHISIPVITCKGRFNSDNNGSFHYDNGNVIAENAVITNNGSNHITAAFNIKQDFDMNVNGSDHANMNVNAQRMLLNVNGSCRINLNYKGDEAIVSGKGSSNLNMTVDCAKLDVTSLGSTRITVKGTADATTINNRGISKVDVSELNKF